ncbi:MAG: LCP family protein [Lactobacillales bacterium]|jgi:LCP family protein required for cell wall assembly|nr:LCP family protein [Lactobacillales bacterium]
MSRKKKIFLIVLSILAVFEAIAAGVGLKLYIDAKKVMNKTYIQIKRKSKAKEEIIKATKPFSILLLGIDSGDALERDGGKWGGRSDSIILATVNPKSKQTTVVSFPRDLYVELDGPDDNEYTGMKDKINHAFARGEEGMSMDTVSKLMGAFPINYCIAINMIGMAELVDAVGGITIEAKFGTIDGKHLDKVPVPDDLAISKGMLESDEAMNAWEASAYGYDFPAIFQWISEGKQKMNGRTALNYARFRHDGDGTYGRDQRQRDVLQKLLEKLFSLNSFIKYKKIFKTVGSNVRTILNWNDLVRIRKTYPFSVFKKAVSLQLPGIGDTIDGVSYQLVPKNILLQAQNYMRQQMEFSVNTSLQNSKQPTYESVTGLQYQGELSLNLPDEKKKAQKNEGSSEDLDEAQSEDTKIE